MSVSCPRLVAFAVLVLPVTVLARDDAEVSYKGQPASYWIAKLGEKDESLRREAVAALGAIGPRAGKAAVPALIKALHDDRDEIRKAALEALGQFGTEAKPAVPALISALADRDKAYRMAATKALGGIGPEARPAVPELVRLLAEEKDPNVRLAAARALGHMGPSASAAVPALGKMLGGSGISNRTAAEALGKIGPEAVPELARAVKPTALAAPVGVASRDRQDFHQIMKVLVGQGPEAMRIVGKLLHDPDPASRLAAAHTLKATGVVVRGPATRTELHPWYQKTFSQEERASFEAAYRESYPVLVKTLRDKEVPVRVAAAQAVGEFGSAAKDAIGELIRLLPEGRTGQAAAEALSAIGADAVPSLLAVCKDKDPVLARKATLALVRMNPPSAAASPTLVEALGDKMESVQKEATTALVALGPDAVPAVVTVLKDKHRMAAAFRVIERLGPQAKAAIPALVPLLRDSPPVLRRSAVLALGHIGKEAKGAVPALEAVVKEDGDSKVRQAAIEALKKIR